MAFLKITRECLWQPDLFDIIVDAFDKMTEVKNDSCNLMELEGGVLKFIVSNDEVKDIEGQICPTILSLPGIKPFIISWI